MKDWKRFELKNLKADEPAGTVEAVFATLGVVDSDGDIIAAGAVGQQNVRMSAYGHGSWQGHLPVGKGRVFERGNDAVFKGRFFTETEHGNQTYLTVKAMGDMQEWSFALPDLDAQPKELEDGTTVREITRVAIPEVSPVLMGAGVDTRTLAIKSQLTLGDQAESILADLRGLVGRVKVRAELRQEANRSLPDATVKALVEIAKAAGSLPELVQVAEPPPEPETEAVSVEGQFELLRIIRDEFRSTA